MCGMTREQDIAHAVDLGVDAIGLIFYPKSSRAVSIKQAEHLLRNIPLFVDVVAVVVNPTVHEVAEILKELPVQWLQFHGDETQAFCAQFQKAYIKAIAAQSKTQLESFISTFNEAPALLIDTPSDTMRGGSGQVFDWDIIPAMHKKPLILAGGLQVENVASAIAQVQPDAVDVCSGIEEAPGLKDHRKMSAFVEALRGSM
jgi:phosphoribosylanthranilate isomerase